MPSSCFLLDLTTSFFPVALGVGSLDYQVVRWQALEQCEASLVTYQVERKTPERGRNRKSSSLLRADAPSSVFGLCVPLLGPVTFGSLLLQLGHFESLAEMQSNRFCVRILHLRA